MQSVSQKASTINPRFKAKKPRASTPNRAIRVPKEESRDKLAKTISSHDKRRRKRAVESQDEDKNDETAHPNSPTRVNTLFPLLIITNTSQSATKVQPMKKLKAVIAQSPPKPLTGPSKTARSQPVQKSKSGINVAASQPIKASMKASTGTRGASQPTKPSSDTFPWPSSKVTPGTSRGESGKSTTERSRSNSSTTLKANSAGNSQSNQRNDANNKVTIIKPKKVKLESVAMAELNVLSRRYFLTYLSNQYVNEPIRAVFPGLRVDNSIYKNTRRRIQSSYKT